MKFRIAQKVYLMAAFMSVLLVTTGIVKSIESDNRTANVILYGMLAALVTAVYSVIKMVHIITDPLNNKLLRSEERFHSLFNFGVIGEAIASPGGKFLEVNNALCEILGYTKEELLNMTWQQITHPGDFDDNLSQVRRVLSGEITGFRVNKRYIHKSGRVLFATVWVNCKFTKERSPDYFVVLIEDITKQRIMAEERDTFFDASPDMACVFNDRYLIQVNPMFEKVLGFTKEELYSKPFLEFIHPHGREAAAAAISKQLNTGVKTIGFENRCICKNGDIKVLSWTAAPLFEDGIMYATARDITQQKEMAAKLIDEVASRKRAEGHLKLLIDASFEGIVISEKGRILSTNKQFAEMFGYELEEIHAKMILDFVAPQSRKIVLDHITERYDHQYECLGLKKDGTTINVEIRVKYIWQEGERIIRLSAIRDITAQRKYDELLRLQGEIISNMEEGVALGTSDGTIVYSNPMFNGMFGYEENELTGKNISIINAPTGLAPEETARQILSELEVPGSWNGNVLNIKKDGTNVCCHSIVSTFEHETYGKVWIAVNRDITRETENEERLALIAESISEVFWMADVELSRMLYVSPGYESVWGTTPGALYENPRAFIDSIHKEDVSAVLADLERKRTTGQPFSHEYRIIRPDGTVRWIWDRGFPITNLHGKVNRYAGIATDITERKEMQEKVFNTEKRLSAFKLAIFERSPIGMAIMESKTGRIQAVNKAYCEITGYTESELMLRSSQEITYPKDIQPENEQMERLIDCEITPFTMEKRCLQKGNTVVWVNMKRVPLCEDGETPDYHVSMIEDITKRKALEIDLQRSLIKNQSMVKDLTMLLKEVHHRVKNNLQIISSLLSLQCDSIDDENIRETFNVSTNRIKAMSLIHEKLYQSPNLSEIDADEYIQELSSDLIHSYIACTGRIEFRFDIGITSINIDVIISVGLIMNEILTNSLKYAFPNGRDGLITIGFNRTPDDQYMLIISDDGVGIPEEVDIEKTRSLGLHLVYDLAIRKLHGKIDIDRSNGTRYTIVFPSSSLYEKRDTLTAVNTLP
ncbi:MAG: PAS domain S-box protein [Nitrospirae bacterium]|nr:PAS domain S-box protein [Nitrospirota bacterium]